LHLWEAGYHQLAMMKAIVLLLCCHAAAGKIVTITGATGRTGSMVYKSLKAQGVTVRGLVRNVTKAKEYLGCDKCDESEGIFVGDVMKAETLAASMVGADTLVVTTGPAYHCAIPSIFYKCKFYPGAEPYNMSWIAVKNQVSSFASSTGPALKSRHVILLSNDMTTEPDNALDKIDNSHGCFYALNGEAATMASGVTFTILKANGLNDGDAAKKEIVVGHDDQGWSGSNPNFAYITRSDIARLLTYAASNPDKTKGLRFDVTSKRIGGTPTIDAAVVFTEAKYPWQPQRSATSLVV